MSQFAAGSILANRYRLVSLLGQGGMGSVWRAHHLTLNSPVAIKLVDPQIAATETGLDRFMREAQAAAVLRSPHVVQTLDYGMHEGIPYIAMELMEGESLADRLEREGRLSPADTLRFLTHVARAVGKAHDAGIIHRDLKPDNIFIVRNDDEEIAKVLDFGIAKLTHPGDLAPASRTQTGAVMGTPYYMSPEQAEGTKAIDRRTDLWAMGVIAYQCLVGKLPFGGDSLGELILKICTRPLPVPSEHGRVPAGFDAWFARACSRNPEERFDTARKMIEALRLLVTRADGAEPFSVDSYSSGVPELLRSETVVPLTKPSVMEDREASTPRAVYIGLGIVAVLLGGLALFALVGGPDEQPAPGSSAGVVAAPSPPQAAASTGAEGVKVAEPAAAPQIKVEPATSAEPQPTPAEPPAVPRTTARAPRAQPSPAPRPAAQAPKPKADGTPPDKPTDFGF